MRILLIRPVTSDCGRDSTSMNNRYNIEKSFTSKYIFPPLNLQVIAGLTPEEHSIRIIDEFVEPIDFSSHYDLVGVTSYGNSAHDIEHLNDVINRFRDTGNHVVLGGPNAGLPDISTDSKMLGECEQTWPQILRDTANGSLKEKYSGTGTVNLQDYFHKRPRRDLTRNRHYPFHSIETSRGCTNNCSFCINPLSGPYRTYPVDRTISEISDCLEHPTSVKGYLHFADNNMASMPSHKIELLRRAREHNIFWHAYSDISAGRNPKLLRAFANSGCLSLCIGIESLSQASLDFIGKNIVPVREFKDSIKAIRDYGIQVSAGFILGLYRDNRESIRDIYSFSEEAGIKLVIINMLSIDGRTKLAKDLEREGALEISEGGYIPKTETLSFYDLKEEFRWLDKRIMSNPSIRQGELFRQLRMIKHLRPPLNPRIGLRNITRLALGNIALDNKKSVKAESNI